MLYEDPLIMEQTLQWIRSFVIAYNLCPFAKGPVNKNTLRLIVSDARKTPQALEDLMSEIHVLDTQASIETSLLLFPNAFKDFYTYLDLADVAEQLLITQNYEGIYQLATFHPNYYFADTYPEEASNYTNRSPYPMLHILREEQLAQAIAAYKNTDEIPERNKALLNQLGLEQIKKLISAL